MVEKFLGESRHTSLNFWGGERGAAKTQCLMKCIQTFLTFFFGGGWYVSSERPPVADTQPSITAAIAQNRLRNAKGAFILVLNAKQ